MRQIISIQELHKTQHIASTIGDLPKALRPAIVIWAKHMPRHDNLPLIEVAQRVSERPVQVYVDDIAAKLFCKRNAADQEKYNHAYREFFESKNCAVTFSSELYKELYRDNLLMELLQFAKRVSVSRFLRSLPEKKLDNFEALDSSEIMNLLLEVFLFEHVTKTSNVIVVRHFTQAVIMSHRQISLKPLSAIVLPTFSTNQDIDTYIKDIQYYYPK